MSNLAVVNKVCFGTPEFMFMRRDLDRMIKERDKLRWGTDNYLINKERVDFLQNTIRAMALNVYFKPRDRKKIDASPDVPLYVPRALRKKEKPKKKEKAPRKTYNENQVLLFDKPFND